MKRNYKKYALWSLLSLLLLLVVARLLLSPLGTHGINRWFAQQGIESQIEDLRFDLYDGRVELTGLRARKGENRALDIDRFVLGWSWSALFERQLKLETVQLSGFELEAERRPDGRLLLAAIELSQSTPVEDGRDPASAGDTPSWSFALHHFKVEDFDACYRDPPRHDYCNRYDLFEWTGPVVFDPARADATELPLSASGELKIIGLAMQNNLLQRRMLGFETLSLTGIEVEDPDRIAIESMALQKLALLEKTADPEDAEITRLERLEIDGLRLERQRRLEIERIAVFNQEGSLTRGDDDKLDISEWLQPYQSEDTAGEADAAPASAPFTFAIGRLEYLTDRSLKYVDLSLSNTFVIDLNRIELILENLDSADTERQSRIEYRANYAKHGRIELSGTATPLDPTPTLDMKGSIKGLDLPEFSAFTAAAIGHRIKSGQLDATLEIKAVDSVLDSNIDLRLDHLQLAAVSEKDRDKVDQKLGFPLNTSLSLLKDRDDVIELSIPVTGDINSPGFDPTDAITRATSAAITAAVINYYTPFGLVTVVDGLFSLATALRFDPVVFESGAADIAGVDAEGLDKIARLMRERPGVSVTLCAYTNSEDRKRLLPETAEIAIDELELSKEQVALLEQLGENRRDRVEDYLVAKQVDPARLVSCEAEHSEGEGLAGVEISI